MHTLLSSTFKCILILTVAASLQSCSLFEEDEELCKVTAEPLTNDDLTFPENAVYRGRGAAVVKYLSSTCSDDSNTHTTWRYSGEAIYDAATSYTNAVPPALLFDQSSNFEFLTGGTVCMQLSAWGDASAELCKEVTVHRKHVWNRYHKDFPGGSTKQQVTMTLAGDVYSGFGMFNNWYKFDTTTFEWTPKAVIPSVVDFNAFAGFAIDGVGYIVGNNSKLFAYNPGTDTWTEKGVLPELVSTILNLGAFSIRSEYSFSVLGASLGGKGYFGLGNMDRLFEYDPANNSWTELTKKPVKGVIGDHSFAYNGEIFSGEYVYTITSDSWAKGNANFNVSAGYSPGFAPFNGVMYGGRSGKTVTFDGANVTLLDLNGADQFVQVPLLRHGNGASTGNFLIFPRLMGANGSDEMKMTYYVDR
ncbi:MAG: hypothetical protein K8H85_03005 [Cyclobacteriaceae bacterium]|nr:hypothetical protein [Cyclobacteriaceae bacterium]